MANQPLSRALPSEVFSVARKVMDDAVAFYLANGGPAVARQHIEELASSLKFYPDITEAYYDALAAINTAEKAEQLKAEEKAQQDQRDLLLSVMGMINTEQDAAKPKGKPQQRPKGVLPQELSTDKAMRIWRKLQQAGYIDDHYQPVNLSRTMSAVVAEKMAALLDISDLWKPFEQLWDRNNMKADYNHAMNLMKTRGFLDELNSLLAEFRT